MIGFYKVLYSIFIFIFGLVMGSFYNVVGLRLPKKESIIKPKSHCPKCHHQLKWKEKIPLLSYLILNGKCSACKEPISLIYPFIELLTGIMFLFDFWLFNLSENFFLALLISSLVSIIFVSDSRYYIIDDEPLIIVGILALIVKIYFHGPSIIIPSLFGGVIGFLFAYALRIFGFIAFKKESLGGGDIKLSFLAGIFLGAKLGILYLILASFLAFPYAVYLSFKKSDHLLPFGPFLVSSIYIIFLNLDKFTKIITDFFTIR